MKYSETSAEFVKCLPFRKRHAFHSSVKHKLEASRSALTSPSTAQSPPLDPLPTISERTKSPVLSRPHVLIKLKKPPEHDLMLTHQKMKQEELFHSTPEDTLYDMNSSQDCSQYSTERDPTYEEDEENKIYCICKQPYNPNMWMIACDKCNEWYHGKCVRITALEAKKIKVYVCPLCQEKDGLETVYEIPKRIRKKHSSGSPNSNNLESVVSSSPDSTRSPSPTSHEAVKKNKKRKKSEVLIQADESNSGDPTKRQRIISSTSSFPSSHITFDEKTSPRYNHVQQEKRDITATKQPTDGAQIVAPNKKVLTTSHNTTSPSPSSSTKTPPSPTKAATTAAPSSSNPHPKSSNSREMCGNSSNNSSSSSNNIQKVVLTNGYL